MTGIKELIADCSKQSRTNGYVEAIDGRKLFSRSPHSALNLLLQGSAGIIAKQWMINYHTLAHDIPFYQSAFVHDEFQCTCLTGYEDQLKQALVDGAAMVTSQFNMNIPIRSDAVSGQSWAETH